MAIKNPITLTPQLLKTVLLAALALGLLVSVYYQNWLNAAVVFGIILLSWAPTLFARQFSVALPTEFDLAALIFIFAAIFLGELADFYERFWWWDELLHLTSGLLLGMLGLCLIWVLNFSERIDLELSHRFMCLFAFTFALSIGAIWEIFEYSVDSLLGMNMQKTGLDDTMKDLMVDALGAFIVAIGANAFLATGRQPLLSYWVKRFVDANRSAIIRRAKAHKESSRKKRD